MLYSEIPPENVRTIVIPFINQYFCDKSVTDYANKYVKLEKNHGEIAVHVEAIMVSCSRADLFPINSDNTTFFIYKLNRSDPELEMIEVTSELMKFFNNFFLWCV